jgi:hypothetical protein
MSKIVQKGLQRLPLAIAVVAALQVMPVFAQDQAPATDTSGQSTSATQQPDQAAEHQKAKELETVTVSGTLLKRPEYQTTSPVQVIDVQNNIAAGQFDTADFIMTTTAAAGSTQINGQFGGYIVEGGTGVQSVNLRGLGPGRTLVLLDGQRPGPAGTRGQVGAFDLNVIPQVILSRIEVIKDGSSSLYGSDAISGVVNAITRKRIDRPEVSFAASMPQHGGGEQYSVSFANGWNFDKGSIVAAAQLDRLNALKVGDRDFLSCSEDRIWGTDGQRIDRADHSILQGTSLAGCNNLYANTIINYFNSRIRYVPSKDGSTVGPFPGYHPRPYPTKTYANSPQAYYEDQLNFPFYKDAYAINQRQRASVYAASNFTFGDVNWNTQFLFNRRESKSNGWRQFFPVVYNAAADDYFQPIMPFTSNSKQTVDYFYGTTKLEGLFASTDSWSWEVDAGYSRSSGDYSGMGIDVRKSGDLTRAGNEADTPPVDYFDPGFLNGTKMAELANAIGINTKGNTLYTQANAKGIVTGNLFSLPAGDVGAAFGGGHGVAVALDEAVARRGPVDRPFDLARGVEFLAEINGAGEGAFGIGRGGAERFIEVIGQSAGEVEGGLKRRFAVVDGGFPADFDAREEIGLGANGFEQARRFEAVRAENLGIRVEGDGGAAAVVGGTDLLHRALGQAAREALFEEFLVAGDLHHHRIRERIDHRGPDAMEAARGLIGLAGELAACVQRAEDDFEGGFLGEFRVWFHRDAAAIVAHGEGIIGVQFDFDARGVPGDGFVHRVVEDFGDEVMQRAFIGAADIHAGAFAHRLQPFEDFDAVGVVVAGIGGGEEIVGHVLLFF